MGAPKKKPESAKISADEHDANQSSEDSWPFCNPPKEWPQDDWDGMTEEEAFEEEPLEVLKLMGEEIAEQQWSGGSCSSVYEYRGRFFVLDEVEMTTFDNPADALKRAGIRNDAHDKISYVRVAPEYKQYV